MATSTSATTATHPAKQLVRAYLAQRCQDATPPPAPEEIRRQLGWTMLLATTDDKPDVRG